MRRRAASGSASAGGATVGDEVMCPSYLATGEEKHSTRGRAQLLHEMTRGEVIADGWDSDAVEEALSLCLSCKGCKADCPVGVDVATWKAEFRSHHYANKRRPRSAVAMGHIDRWARARAPTCARRRQRRLRDVAREAVRRHRSARAPASLLVPDLPRVVSRAWERGIGNDRVLIWPDTFNNHFRPETLIAATQLLERAGFKVDIPAEPLCCGRPLYDWGYLDRAKQQFERTFGVLAPEIAAGTPIVALEPACASRLQGRAAQPLSRPARCEAAVCAGALFRELRDRPHRPLPAVPARGVGAGTGALPPSCGDRFRAGDAAPRSPRHHRRAAAPRLLRDGRGIRHGARRRSRSAEPSASACCCRGFASCTTTRSSSPTASAAASRSS